MGRYYVLGRLRGCTKPYMFIADDEDIDVGIKPSFSLKCNSHTDFVCNHSYDDIVIYRNMRGHIKAKCGKCGMEYDSMMNIAIDYELKKGCCSLVKWRCEEQALGRTCATRYLEPVHNDEDDMAFNMIRGTYVNIMRGVYDFYSRFPTLKPVVTDMYSTLYRRHFKCGLIY